MSPDEVDDRLDAIEDMENIKESNEHEHTTWLQSRIQEAKNIADEEEKLQELRLIAEEVANQFTYDMQILEGEIDDILKHEHQLPHPPFPIQYH